MSNQVPVGELRDWLRRSLASNLTQAERERDKLIAEIAKAINSLPTYCGQLSRKAEQDMETKRDNRAQYRASKAVVRLTNIVSEMCKSVNMPATKDSVSLRNLQRQTSKLASDSSQSRMEWLRQIRPYYIIDMMTMGGNIDKVRRLGDELHNFLMGRGTILRSLEELDEKLTSLNKAQASRDSATTQRQALEQKLLEHEKLGQSLHAQVDEIRQNPKIKDYIEIDSQLRSFRTDLLRSGFSRLGRPLKKLLSISERGDYPLPIELRESAKEYAKKPFTTFLREEDGYPRLKAVMSTLSKAVSSGKLALKQREAKKVLERSEKVVSEDSLAKLHSKSKELKAIYDKFLADQETAAFVLRLKELRENGKGNRKEQESLKAELQRSLDTEKRFNEQIDALVKDIEVFSRKLSGAAVKVQRS